MRRPAVRNPKEPTDRQRQLVCVDLCATVVTSSKLKKLAEGREAEIFAYEDGRVLRLFREPRDLASLEREADAMRAARSVVPNVPEVFATTTVDGRPGLIMQRIDGPDLLTIIGRKPWTFWRAGRITGDLQARLNGVTAPASMPAEGPHPPHRLAGAGGVGAAGGLRPARAR